MLRHQYRHGHHAVTNDLRRAVPVGLRTQYIFTLRVALIGHGPNAT